MHHEMVLGFVGATPARRFRVVRQAVSSVALTDGAVRDASEADESALSDVCMAYLLPGFLFVGIDANSMGGSGGDQYWIANLVSGMSTLL